MMPQEEFDGLYAEGTTFTIGEGESAITGFNFKSLAFSATTESVDVSTLSGNWRRKAPGMKDGNEIPFSAWYSPALLAALWEINGVANQVFEATHTDNSGWSGVGFISSLEIGGIEPGQYVEVNGILTVDGELEYFDGVS